MSSDRFTGNPFDVTDAPPPPYIVSEADHERWEVAGRIAARLWELHGDGAPLDGGWYMMTQRSIFRSDIPTGTAADAA